MKLQTAGFSHLGKVRKSNDDAYCIDKDLYLFAVCDGVAQSKYGKIAAETTLSYLREYLRNHQAHIKDTMKEPSAEKRMELADCIQRGVEKANEAVYAIGEKDPSKRGLATTLDLILFCGRYAFLAHVGDSRVYLHRRGKARCLTEDHTVAYDFLKSGQWSVEQSESSPYKNVLSRAIGAQITVQVDLLQLELLENDVFLLCSDGAYKHHTGVEFVSSIETSPHLEQASGPKEMVEKLIRESLDRGGTDNITCLCVRVENLSIDETEVSAEHKVAALEKIPLFKFLSYKEVNKVLEITETKQISAGAQILQEGQMGSDFFLVLKGRVQIQKGDQILIERGKGEMLGEFSILNEAPRSASVYAVENTTVLRFSKESFITFLRKDNHLATKILWALSQELEKKVRDTTRALADAKLDLEDVREEFPFLLKQTG